MVDWRRAAVVMAALALSTACERPSEPRRQPEPAPQSLPAEPVAAARPVAELQGPGFAVQVPEGFHPADAKDLEDPVVLALTRDDMVAGYRGVIIIFEQTDPTLLNGLRTLPELSPQDAAKFCTFYFEGMASGPSDSVKALAVPAAAGTTCFATLARTDGPVEVVTVARDGDRFFNIWGTFSVKDDVALAGFRHLTDSWRETD